MSEKINYVSGITPAVARRIGRYGFGDNYIRMDIDKTNKEYRFLLKETPDKVQSQWWKENWGGAWKLCIVGNIE